VTTPHHEPHRNEDIANWIKRHRDVYWKNSRKWTALDDLLDDYREHADTGTPLHFEVKRGQEL